MPTRVGIRAAAPDDARPIADISHRGWGAAYRDLVPADFLARRSPDALEEAWRDYLTAPPSRQTLLVAEDAGEVVGFVRFGPEDESRRPGGGAEICGFYVAPERIGQGIGRALFGQALEQLRAEGCTKVVLWTFTGNRRAEEFYARAGLGLDGACRFEEQAGAEEGAGRSAATRSRPPRRGRAPPSRPRRS